MEAEKMIHPQTKPTLYTYNKIILSANHYFLTVKTRKKDVAINTHSNI